MKQTFMENGRTSVENRGGMKEEGTVGGPAGTGKKRSHRLPEAAEVDRNLPIQVAAVCDTTGKLHPLWFRYADADRRVRRVEIAAVLTERTIMAHCVWLGDDEVRLMKERGAFVAHSPSSNINIASGIAPVRRYLDEGLKVGLATDVAGGSSLSLLRMVSDAVQSSKVRWRIADGSLEPLSLSEAFYLASKGGGSFFGIQLWDFKIEFFTSSAGAFFVYGLSIAIFNAVYKKMENVRRSKTFAVRVMPKPDVSAPDNLDPDASVVTDTDAQEQPNSTATADVAAKEVK